MTVESKPDSSFNNQIHYVEGIIMAILQLNNATCQSD